MGHKAPLPVPGVRRSAILLLLLFNIHRVFFLAPAGVESSQSCDLLSDLIFIVSSFWLQQEWNLLNLVTNFLIARFLGQQTSSLYVVSNTGAD